jgi:hypothetical protein
MLASGDAVGSMDCPIFAIFSIRRVLVIEGSSAPLGGVEPATEGESLTGVAATLAGTVSAAWLPLALCFRIWIS